MANQQYPQPPPPQPRDSRDFPRDIILYFMTTKVLPWTAGDLFLLNPCVGPLPIILGTQLVSNIPCLRI